MPLEPQAGLQTSVCASGPEPLEHGEDDCIANPSLLSSIIVQQTLLLAWRS
jgi:hypothetical protein